MAYESEVRNQAGLLREAVKSAQSKRNRVNANTDNACQWWIGEGAKAFAQEYREIDADVLRAVRCLERAADGLNRLPSLIQRAEEERRREAEKKAAAQRK